MKQRLRKLLSGFLCFALIASAFVGALSASVLPAKADDFPASGYLDDLFDEAFEDVPSEYLSTLENLQSMFDDRFDDYLIVVIHDSVSNGWYFAAYDGTNGADPVRWCLNNSSYTPYYTTLLAKYSNNGYYDTACNFIAGCKFQGSSWYSHGSNAMGNTSLSQLVNWSTGWQYLTPNPLYLNMSGYECYSNRDLYKWNNDDSSDSRFMIENLNPGSELPPITEYHWFKFNLGDRWYITTTDQSYVNNMVQEDETYYVWSLQIMYEDGSFHDWYIESDMMVRLPYAQNFIPQQLENLSPSGVFAYDVTSWINNGQYVNATSNFDQVFMTPGGYYEWTYIAYSDDIVSFVLTEQEEEETHNNAWNEINYYIINYPTGTIVPEVLADQLSGHNAVGSGMGGVRAPNQIQQWMNQVYYDTDFFQYDLSIGGLDASYESIINFDILDTIIVPAQNVLTSTSIDYWDHTYQLVNGTIDTYHIGNLDYSNPLFEQFDLILITKSNAQFMGDTHLIYDVALNGTQAYVGDIHRAYIAHDLYYEPVYWILTNRAIEKSQLYVFCDSQSKLYKLLSDYINKRDLWDSSFFEFTMSLFWELETINGYLLRFEQEYLSWDLSNKLSSIVTSLQEIADNTSETDVDPWYLALFNWIKSFEPSNLDFIVWVEEYDYFVDDLPDPGGATIIPFPTAAPTALPTVAVAGG